LIFLSKVSVAFWLAEAQIVYVTLPILRSVVTTGILCSVKSCPPFQQNNSSHGETNFRQILHRWTALYSIVHDAKQRQLQTVAGKAAP